MLIDGVYYSDPELISYIKKLKNTIAMNEESQKIADGVIEQLKQENAELKAMLKQAMATINSLCYCGSGNCNHCTYNCDDYACHDSEGFKWVHENKIIKLIGEESNG